MSLAFLRLQEKTIMKYHPLYGVPRSWFVSLYAYVQAIKQERTRQKQVRAKIEKLSHGKTAQAKFERL